MSALQSVLLNKFYGYVSISRFNFENLTLGPTGTLKAKGSSWLSKYKSYLIFCKAQTVDANEELNPYHFLENEQSSYLLDIQHKLRRQFRSDMNK